MMWLYLFGAAILAVTFLFDVWLTVDYQQLANIALIFIATFVTVFTVRYAFWSNWRASHIGKVFLIKCVFLALVLWQAVVSVWWDTDYPFRHVIRFLIYGTAAVAYAGMIFVLVRQQRRDRAEVVE